MDVDLESHSDADTEEPPAASTKLVYFNFGTEKKPANLIYNPNATSKKKRATMDRRCRNLVKLNMPLWGYVMSGWSKNRGYLRHKWHEWHAHSGLYDRNKDAEARKDCSILLDQVVKDFSMTWRKAGWWSQNQKFCQVCRETGGDDDGSGREGETVTFADWLVEAATKKNANANFEAPCDMYCFDHLKLSVQASLDRGLENETYTSEHLEALIEICDKAESARAADE